MFGELNALPATAEALVEAQQSGAKDWGWDPFSRWGLSQKVWTILPNWDNVWEFQWSFLIGILGSDCLNMFEHGKHADDKPVLFWGKSKFSGNHIFQ